MKWAGLVWFNGISNIVGHLMPNTFYKLATLVEGDPKAFFSIATTRSCGKGATPFPGLLHFTLDPYLFMLSIKQGGIKYHFF